MQRILCLAVLLLAVPALSAQDPDMDSHRATGSNLDQETDPNAAAAARLGKTRESLADEKLAKTIEGISKNLLDNPELFKSLKDKIDPREIERLKQQFKDSGLAGSPEIQKLLRDPKLKPLLDDKQKDALQQWIQRTPDPTMPPGPMPGPIPLPPPSAMPPIPLPPPSQPSTLDWVKPHLEGVAKRAEGWARGAGGQGFRDFVSRLMANRQSGAAMAEGFGKRLSGLSGYIPRLSSVVPRNMPNLRLPNLRGPGSALEAGKSLLFLVVAVLLLFVLWRAGSMYQAYRARLATEWRLGPWPVLPHQVSTREQLVQAFEHLAYLIFGRPARSMSHEELADGLARQPALDPAMQADAARRLADSYEQARYALPQDELTDEQLAQARQQLAYLAGSAA